MTIRSASRRFLSVLALGAAAALPLLGAEPWARGDVAATHTSITAAGPLQIHVTAVQGGAQYRTAGQNKWQTLKNGLDTEEGVEFRTGPRGTVQFTIGTDQVFRVDRLSVVKVLRASLLPDGNIKTDVGMTYGRVSKDVDQPARPHEDVIVSPAATLAVRGTRVSLYDSPPYLPEARSLTGEADYGFHKWLKVHFGKKGEGTVEEGGTADSAAHYMLSFLPIDPKGAWAGRTDTEKNLYADGDMLDGSPGSIYPHNTSSMIGGQLITQGFTSSSSASTGPMAGQLNFGMTWGPVSGSPLDTVVGFTVTSPLGEIVSNSMPGPVSSGGFYASGSSTVADMTGNGSQTIQWGTSYVTGSYPVGTYSVTETLKGTLAADLATDPTAAVLANISVGKFSPTGAFSFVNLGAVTLNAGNPSQTFLVSVPSLTPVLSSPNATAIQTASLAKSRSK